MALCLPFTVRLGLSLALPASRSWKRAFLEGTAFPRSSLASAGLDAIREDASAFLGSDPRKAHAIRCETIHLAILTNSVKGDHFQSGHADGKGANLNLHAWFASLYGRHLRIL